MDKNIQVSEKNFYEYNSFFRGYGEFPYIILKVGLTTFIQIPIHFNANGDFINFPGTHLDNVSETELVFYQKDKTSPLHNRLIELCERIKKKIESDRNLEFSICLVEGPEIAYYFKENSFVFNASIPRGGTLLTQENKIIAVNIEHYIIY
jgi:hypothetical protein